MPSKKPFATEAKKKNKKQKQYKKSGPGMAETAVAAGIAGAMSEAAGSRKRKPESLSIAQMNHSPAEMGHSPAQNHHYGTRKGESIKQEKMNLLKDNPVAKDASGGRDMSWMSKHSRSAMMMKGPMEMGHDSPAEKHCM